MTTFEKSGTLQSASLSKSNSKNRPPDRDRCYGIIFRITRDFSILKFGNEKKYYEKIIAAVRINTIIPTSTKPQWSEFR